MTRWILWRARRRLFLIILAAGLLVPGLALAGLYAYAGMRGVNVLLQHGASAWVAVGADDPRLSASMRRALREPAPEVQPGHFEWQRIDPGFDVAELPVIADGDEVDRILLARIDPAQFRFVVRNAPSGGRELGDWMKTLGAVLVINGSFYAQLGTPATPVLSDGTPLGPQSYDGRHGAFVASLASVGIHDLAREDWHMSFRGAQDAMVSYPLLLAADGSSRVTADPHWLANRSFVGQDGSGRILVGTTVDAFFSLERLARFIRQAPLDLTLALNLDGGPVASQAIVLNKYKRDFCGQSELAMRDGNLKLLEHGFGKWGCALPIVLAVLRK